MPITVIIPTCNRAEILRKTLQGYSTQTGEHEMVEMLVIDDGSTDHTASVVEERKRNFPVPLRYLQQQNGGLASVRNYGIREARADLILFGDDDIIPSPRLVAEHVSWHKKRPESNIGVLGYVAWAPELKPTPFMVWEGLYGPQFKFGYFKPGAELDISYMYFCNTSVKAAFLRKNGIFSEDFRGYCWEDIELSYRLYQKGYRVLYNPDALGYHYKYEKFDQAVRRIAAQCESYPVFEKTDAGKYFIELGRSSTSMDPALVEVSKRLLRPLKNLSMRLLKPLLDTRIPFPGWVYERVFHYYAHTLRKAATRF